MKHQTSNTHQQEKSIITHHHSIPSKIRPLMPAMHPKTFIVLLTFVVIGHQKNVLANTITSANSSTSTPPPSTTTYVKSKTPFHRLPLDLLPPIDLSVHPDADLLLRAVTNQPTRRVPVWCMRQAGRHLPEFQALSQQGYDFFTMCQIPELAVEISLQPLRRYGGDAVIIFSDILVIPQAMGMEIEMVKGKETGIRCLICGMVSYNDNDIENEYCGNCHQFHNILEYMEQEKTENKS